MNMFGNFHFWNFVVVGFVYHFEREFPVASSEDVEKGIGARPETCKTASSR